MNYITINENDIRSTFNTHYKMKYDFDAKAHNISILQGLIKNEKLEDNPYLNKSTINDFCVFFPKSANHLEECVGKIRKSDKSQFVNVLDGVEDIIGRAQRQLDKFKQNIDSGFDGPSTQEKKTILGIFKKDDTKNWKDSYQNYLIIKQYIEEFIIPIEYFKVVELSAKNIPENTLRKGDKFWVVNTNLNAIEILLTDVKNLLVEPYQENKDFITFDISLSTSLGKKKKLKIEHKDIIGSTKNKFKTDRHGVFAFSNRDVAVTFFEDFLNKQNIDIENKKEMINNI